MTSLLISGLLLFAASLLTSCEGHGRLREPPSRGSMWRDGFNNPRNYNDNELNCGGFGHQWGRQDGKCGICGDPYDRTRNHEAGGKYAKGIIGQTYTEGATIDVRVQITAQHKGWFEFRLCPNNDVTKAATPECLDRYPLEVVGSGSKFRYNIPAGDSAKYYTLRIRLPRGLTCTQCVFQWKWNAGNSWGTDPDGRGCIGCGAQEQFYGCSDIAITGTRGATTPKVGTTTDKSTRSSTTRATVGATSTTTQTTGGATSTTTRTTGGATSTTTRTTGGATSTTTQTTGGATSTTSQTTGGATSTTIKERSTSTVSPSSSSTSKTTLSKSTTSPVKTKATRQVTLAPSGCRARRWFKSTPGGDTWCKQNCPAFCPASHCICGAAVEPTCQPIGAYASVAGMQKWCEANCAQGYCPKTHCRCHYSR